MMLYGIIGILAIAVLTLTIKREVQRHRNHKKNMEKIRQMFQELEELRASYSGKIKEDGSK